MKKCPVCNRTYTDETLNFCLEDGTTLVASTSAASGFGSMPPQSQTWQPQNPIPPQPRKKSKTWLWILGILGIVGVLGFVGLFGLLAFIGSHLDENNNNNNGNRSNRNSNHNLNRSLNLNVNSTANRASNSNSNLNTISNSATTSGRLKYSEMNWGKLDSAVGRGEYIAGEYHVNSKKADNYYVTIVGDSIKDEYVTKNAITKIKARIVSGEPSEFGFGLVVHSDPVPLKNGYAFLIRTNEDPAFCVVKHDNKLQTDIVEWTSAPQIRTGNESNELEVRSNGEKLEFYINGEFATSVADKITNRGIVGLYTSGTPVIAFSDLKIYDNK